MPFRFWTKQNEYAQLKTRARRLEDERKLMATEIYVANQWSKMASANDLLRRLRALEHQQDDLEFALAELAKDVTAVERQLNKLLPFDDGTDAGSERKKDEQNASPSLSPLGLPTTFTRRTGNGTETTALETATLRLCQAGRRPQVHKLRKEVRSLQAKTSDARFSKASCYESP